MTAVIIILHGFPYLLMVPMYLGVATNILKWTDCMPAAKLYARKCILKRNVIAFICIPVKKVCYMAATYCSLNMHPLSINKSINPVQAWNIEVYSG